MDPLEMDKRHGENLLQESSSKRIYISYQKTGSGFGCMVQEEFLQIY